MKRMKAVESDSVKSARKAKDELHKACERASETHERTLHRQEQNRMRIWIERHDHRVHMFSVLQVQQQLYTAGIPLLGAYLLPMANNRTHKERLSQEQNGR